MFDYLKCLLQLLLSPAKGWEDISHEGRDGRRIATTGFYPLTAIVAASCFLRMLYGNYYDGIVSAVIIDFIITFVKFFVAYFISMFILSLKLTDYIEGHYNEKRTSTFVLYSLGLLEVIALLREALPVDVGITLFLPIYVAIIMWKGARYMAVRRDCIGFFMVLVLLAVMLPPYLLGWIFDMLI